MDRPYTYILLVLSLSFASVLRGQATVNEGLETVTLYVNGTTGSDSNPGTEQLPLKTIGAGVSQAMASKAAGVGTKVIVDPGTYRETLNMTAGNKETTLPITVEAATNGTVYVSGAVQFTGWTPYSGNSKMYTTAWPYSWGPCALDSGGPPPEMPIVLRQEMLVVNGTPMTEVLSLSQMLYPGSFFADTVGGVVYVWPPSGTNMSTADVEVPVNSNLLTIAAHGQNSLNGIVIRGLTFEYANSCHAGQAVYVDGSVSNILFDTDSFLWNNASGLAFSGGQYITVENSTANHNGASGYATWEVQDILWQNDVASYNNWRGAQGAFYEWGTGGAHVFSDHGETWTGFNSTYNQTHGLHWDTDDVNITVSSLLSSMNMLGTLIEKNEGPITVTDSLFCTTTSSVTDDVGGLVLRDSENVTMTGNTFYDNVTAQIELTGVPGGIMITNWQTGVMYNLITQNITLTDNVIEAAAGQQLFKDGFLGGNDWTLFVTSLKSNDNTWWDASNSQPFTVPTPADGTLLDWAQWQSTTGQDKNSTFSAPTNNPAALCATPAVGPDYWFIADNGVLTTDGAGNAIFTLTTVPLAGLTGNVTLSVDGVSSIPGAKVTFSPSTITTSGSSVMTFNAATTTAPGTYVITVLANSGNITRTIALQITVPATSIRLSTDSITFSNQAVGTTSPAQTVTVTNTGSNAVSIQSIFVNYGFKQTNTCGSSLAAGKNCTITLTFSPKELITYSGTLTITDSDPTSPQTVAVAGTTVGAPAATFSPKRLSFGNEIYGTPSASQSVTLTNSGTAAMTISSISFTGDDPKDYTQTNNCGSSLAINAVCTIKVTFNPTNTGSRDANLSVADNAPDSPQAVTLTGFGQKALTVSPMNIGYGNVDVGSSASKTVTLTDASTAAITVSSFTFSGSNPGDFSQTNTCNGSVGGNKSCTVTVTFKPKATGSRSATMNVKDSDPTSPQAVTLSGTGK